MVLLNESYDFLRSHFRLLKESSDARELMYAPKRVKWFSRIDALVGLFDPLKGGILDIGDYIILIPYEKPVLSYCTHTNGMCLKQT